uniref:Cytochrome P450 n=1 Tax=Panagrolaimus superbus TaxID=310955 RepID=A0A914YYT6_9BILA
MESFTICITSFLISLIVYYIWQRIQMLKLREKLGFKGPPIGIPQFFIRHIFDLKGADGLRLFYTRRMQDPDN